VQGKHYIQQIVSSIGAELRIPPGSRDSLTLRLFSAYNDVVRDRNRMFFGRKAFDSNMGYWNDQLQEIDERLLSRELQGGLLVREITKVVSSN